MPALAVAEALRARGASVSLLVARARPGAAAERLAASGIPVDTVPVRGLPRRPSLAAARALLEAALAAPRIVRILRRRGAHVVVGGGGYVAGPAALAGWLTRRPVVLMEADSRLGLANRLAAPLARRVALAFPLEGRRGRRYAVTGRPVSRAVAAATRTAGRRALGIPPDATVVLVAGGSQGARTLNRAAAAAFGPDPPFWVLHAAGPERVEETRALLDGGAPGPRYRLEGLFDDYPSAVAAADLVISRAGGSIFELAAIGRPAILVPYPHATGDHQTANARWLAEQGAAVVLRDADCTGPRLRELVGALLADRPRLEAMAAASRRAGRPEAADAVAEMALAAARR
jgi:UDP-N-acetylglucosamine--N-acetylmuramyl-(pentapeptide) pyrophosphoryl-undecaprenol N-acetylglucosamine transferase